MSDNPKPAPHPVDEAPQPTQPAPWHDDHWKRGEPKESDNA